MTARRQIDLLSPPFSGHLHPIIAMALILQEHYDVRILSTPTAMASIALAGLIGVPILEGCDDQLKHLSSPDGAVGSNPWRLRRQFVQAIGLLSRLRRELHSLFQDDRPALLIADFTLPTAGAVASELSIGWWTSLPSPCVLERPDGPPAYLGGLMPMTGTPGAARDAIARTCVRTAKLLIAGVYRRALASAGINNLYRYDGTEAAYSPDCILVPGMADLEFGVCLPKATCFLGPMLYTPVTLTDTRNYISGYRRILVTMGTHLPWVKADVFAATVQTATMMPNVEFHFSEGDAESRKIQVMQNVIRFGFVNYETQIAQYDLVVHHGGSGVLYYCLRAGLPSVVYPVDYDQFDNAARIVYAGLAVRMKTLEQMPHLVGSTLDNVKIRARCRDYASVIKAIKGDQILLNRAKDFLNG